MSLPKFDRSTARPKVGRSMAGMIQAPDTGRRRALALSVMALSLGGVLALASPAYAQVAAQGRQVTVQGEGQTAAAPDEATVAGGTQVQSRTAREAMDGNSRAMRQVQEALRGSGITESDIATSALSLRPVIDYQSAGNRPRVVGYAAGHSLRVRVRDLTKLGDVLDRMVSAGANQIEGLQLTVSDWSKKVDEARVAAVVDARRKAEILAQAAGARLGKVLSISEQGGALPPPVMRRMAAPSASSAESVPIATGDQTFRMTVTMVWELVD